MLLLWRTKGMVICLACVFDSVHYSTDQHVCASETPAARAAARTDVEACPSLSARLYCGSSAAGLHAVTSALQQMERTAKRCKNHHDVLPADTAI